jgi:hypothetical protein
MLRLLLLLLPIAVVAQPAVGATEAERVAPIEGYARAAPAAAASSVESLAGYLTRPARTDRERALAIYCWIASNIVYDSSTFGSAPGSEEVLRTRRAVCEGYAVLFEALAEAAGLKAEVIHGDAKGVGPAAAVGPDGLVSHAWNVVFIAGKWELVDATFGAGRREEDGRWVRAYTDHYFLTSPEVFGYDHLPEEARWQLVGRPLSREEFLKRVKVLPPFFEFGLRLDGPVEGRIEAQDSLQLRVGAPQDTLVVASISRNGREVGEGSTFAQREGDEFVLQAAFPEAGNYTLRVFARKRGGADRQYDCALEYSVHARQGTRQAFPRMYGSFQERGCRVEQPLAGVLPAGKLVKFSVCVPGAEEVAVGPSGPLHRLTSDGNGAFSGWVPVQPSGAVVYARFPKQRKYEGLLQYRVD